MKCNHEISKQCREHHEVVIIMVNGREDDAKNENTAPVCETFDDLKNILRDSLSADCKHRKSKYEITEVWNG